MNALHSMGAALIVALLWRGCIHPPMQDIRKLATYGTRWATHQQAGANAPAGARRQTWLAHGEAMGSSCGWEEGEDDLHLAEEARLEALVRTASQAALPGGARAAAQRSSKASAGMGVVSY